MTFPFDPRQNLIVIHAELKGPSGIAFVRLALDTGATSTLFNVGLLVSLGYEPSLSTERVQVTMGSSVEFAPRVTITRLHALGQEKTDFPAICHNSPPSASVDGLLGLDFFREKELRIDFREGTLSIT